MKKAIEQRRHRHFLPTNHKYEDIYLVSYPKSGNTWLKFLIANSIRLRYSIQREVNFFTIHDVIQNVHLSRNISNDGPFNIKDFPRIIKSHSSYNPYYNRVILLVRDPQDVAISYYHFLKERDASFQLSLSDLIRDERYGAKAWASHTKGWYCTLKQGQTVQVFRYEDFIQEPLVQLTRLMNLFGLEIEEDLLKKAILLSSKENMKKSENIHRSTYLVKTKERPFVRSGISSRKDMLCDKDKAYIKHATQDIAPLIGYNL